MSNTAASAGEGQIKEFVFFSNYNEKDVDVSDGCISFNYYESILDYTVRCNATFVDTGYRKDTEDGSSFYEKDDINLTSGEKVHIKVVDGYDTQLDFIDDNHFCIHGQPSFSSESVNKAVFSLNFYSKEVIDNFDKLNHVYGRYDGKIDISVKSILEDSLKTPKQIVTDPVFNSYNFLGHAESPFYLCTNLAKKSVPDEIPNSFGILAGYLFYETYDGYNFRSIDKLFQQEPKRKLIYNMTIGEIPEGYDGKILEYNFQGSMNLDKEISSGSHTNVRNQVFDRMKNVYNENTFSSESTYMVDNNGGLERAVIAKHTEIQEKVTRHANSRSADAGILPTGFTLQQQIPNSQKVNFNIDEIQRQSFIRYNQLYSHRMSISIAGDFRLRAGDLIFCDFPEVSGKMSKVVSQKAGGIYMIADLCHHIDKNGCFTRMNLVRDSIYRKPQ